MMFRSILSRFLKMEASPIHAFVEMDSPLSRAEKAQFFNGNRSKKDKPDAVLDFLRNRGFTQPQITTLVGKLPKILTYDLQNTLSPKLEFFSRSTGFSETEITDIVSSHPFLLISSIKRRVEPVYNYVKGIIGAEKVDNLIRGGSWIFTVDLETKIMPNVELLREVGVPPQFIKFALANCTRIFLSDLAEFSRVVEDVKDMGFDPLKSTFVLALRYRNGEGCLATWNRCSEVYRKWGWSEDDIRVAYTTHPGCMVLSEKKISAVMKFLVNKLGREPRSIARSPQVLFYSMETRIAPRCSVVHRLFLEGLVEEDWSLLSVLPPVEKKFLDKYVTRYSELVPELYDIYHSNKGSGVTRSSEEGPCSAVVNDDGP